MLESYEQAYDLLEQKGVAQASIDELFAPETPVVLPTFLPNPFASRDTSESARYVDVAFDITKYGRSEHAVDPNDEEPTDAAKKDVRRPIDASWFRPRVTDGRFADATRVVVRYYSTAAASRTHQPHREPRPSSLSVALLVNRQPCCCLLLTGPRGVVAAPHTQGWGGSNSSL